MRLLRTSILVALVLLAGAAVGFAQTADDSHDVSIDIVGVATLELNNTGTITLQTTAPTAGNAGDPVSGDTDATKNLHYTLLTSAAQSIQASIDTNINSAAVGYRLDMAATVNTGSHGTAAGTITLTTTDTDIITGINSVATGQTEGVVPDLTYTLVITDSTLLTIGTATRTVTITLTGP
jgi:hypothetical protein